MHKPISTSDGGDIDPNEPDNRKEDSIGDISRVRKATAAGILSSNFIVPMVMHVAATADSR